jgi:hypothetical protein
MDNPTCPLGNLLSASTKPFLDRLCLGLFVDLLTIYLLALITKRWVFKCFAAETKVLVNFEKQKFTDSEIDLSNRVLLRALKIFGTGGGDYVYVGAYAAATALVVCTCLLAWSLTISRSFNLV